MRITLTSEKRQVIPCMALDGAVISSTTENVECSQTRKVTGKHEKGTFV